MTNQNHKKGGSVIVIMIRE